MRTTLPPPPHASPFHSVIDVQIVEANATCDVEGTAYLFEQVNLGRTRSHQRTFHTRVNSTIVDFGDFQVSKHTKGCPDLLARPNTHPNAVDKPRKFMPRVETYSNP